MPATLTSPDGQAVTGIVSASSVFYFLLIPAVTLWYVYWRTSRRHLIELAEKLPGPTGLPLLGNALDLIGKPYGKQVVFVPNVLANSAFDHLYILQPYVIPLSKTV